MNDLALQEALMNPEVDLDRFLLNFKSQLQENYEANVYAIFKRVQEEQNAYAAEVDQLAQAVLGVDVTEAPNRQIALLNESLRDVKKEQDLIEKTLDAKETHLRELERQKAELNHVYHTTASKVNSVRPKLICEKDFYKTAAEATKYVACRNQGYTHANQQSWRF
jgi:predicted  nucleic acid-binding Zn-ribbon protein